jgi:metal-dependent hydrolase (beta-lactamase superfamily II)
MTNASRSTDFVALGHPGSTHYGGLETLMQFRNEQVFCEQLAVKIRPTVRSSGAIVFPC